MIRTDPGSRSLGSDPGIRFRDPRTCLVRCVFIHMSDVYPFHVSDVCQMCVTRVSGFRIRTAPVSSLSGTDSA